MTWSANKISEIGNRENQFDKEKYSIRLRIDLLELSFVFLMMSLYDRNQFRITKYFLYFRTKNSSYSLFVSR